MPQDQTEDRSDVTEARAKVNTRLWNLFRAQGALSGDSKSTALLMETAFREYIALHQCPHFEQARALAKSKGDDLYGVIEAALKAYVEK